METSKPKRKPPINFYFRKRRFSLWHQSPTVCNILYRKSAIGWIENRQDKYVIIFRGNASGAKLAENPNCKWSWKRIIRGFDSVDDAKAFIKADQKAFFDRLYDGIKDGTDL